VFRLARHAASGRSSERWDRSTLLNQVRSAPSITVRRHPRGNLQPCISSPEERKISRAQNNSAESSAKTLGSTVGLCKVQLHSPTSCRTQKRGWLQLSTNSPGIDRSNLSNQVQHPSISRLCRNAMQLESTASGGEVDQPRFAGPARPIDTRHQVTRIHHIVSHIYLVKFAKVGCSYHLNMTLHVFSSVSG
jgi:hypothetical protein